MQSPCTAWLMFCLCWWCTSCCGSGGISNIAQFMQIFFGFLRIKLCILFMDTTGVYKCFKFNDTIIWYNKLFADETRPANIVCWEAIAAISGRPLIAFVSPPAVLFQIEVNLRGLREGSSSTTSRRSVSSIGSTGDGTGEGGMVDIHITTLYTSGRGNVVGVTTLDSCFAGAILIDLSTLLLELGCLPMLLLELGCA